MANTKTYNFFKIKYSEKGEVILETNNPITIEEVQKKCADFFEHTNGYCFPISQKEIPNYVKNGGHVINVGYSFLLDAFKNTLK